MHVSVFLFFLLSIRWPTNFTPLLLSVTRHVFVLLLFLPVIEPIISHLSSVRHWTRSKYILLLCLSVTGLVILHPFVSVLHETGFCLTAFLSIIGPTDWFHTTFSVRHATCFLLTPFFFCPSFGVLFSWNRGITGKVSTNRWRLISHPFFPVRHETCFLLNPFSVCHVWCIFFCPSCVVWFFSVHHVWFFFCPSCVVWFFSWYGRIAEKVSTNRWRLMLHSWTSRDKFPSDSFFCPS